MVLESLASMSNPSLQRSPLSIASRRHRKCDISMVTVTLRRTDVVKVSPLHCICKMGLKIRIEFDF